MEIEYLFSFKQHYLSSPSSIIWLYLWLVPAVIFYKLYKANRFAWGLLIFLVGSGSIALWEYSSLNQKVVKLSYEPKSLMVHTYGGDTIKVNPKEIERFWSISIGRFGGSECYLLIKTNTQDYETVIVKKKTHSCLSDAERFNKFYKKF